MQMHTKYINTNPIVEPWIPQRTNRFPGTSQVTIFMYNIINGKNNFSLTRKKLIVLIIFIFKMFLQQK